MAEKEYIIFCDESDREGKYYSNFYGGLIVGASEFQRVTQRLNQKKEELNLFHEVKWQRVTEPYLAKYAEFIRTFFDEVINGNIKVRIMFRQNAQKPRGLTRGERGACTKSFWLRSRKFIRVSTSACSPA